MQISTSHSESVEVRENNPQKSVLSLYHVGPRDLTQVIRPDSKCLYLLSHGLAH